MTTGDGVYSLRFSLIKILPEHGFDLGSTTGESRVLTARLHYYSMLKLMFDKDVQTLVIQLVKWYLTKHSVNIFLKKNKWEDFHFNSRFKMLPCAMQFLK